VRASLVRRRKTDSLKAFAIASISFFLLLRLV